MRTVSVAETFPGSVHEAETVWYDTSRWSSWVDGLERVTAVGERWPAEGAEVSWQSGPAGRGRVSEQVVDYEPLVGQTVEVSDDSIEGRQSVRFVPDDGSVTIELSLEYRVKRRSLFMPLVDFLFIGRAFATSLRSTLERFGLELEAARKGGVG